ncbi:MAG: signal peptidase I [Dermatophilaceae bacterium]|jgi:signal peptidase I
MSSHRETREAAGAPSARAAGAGFLHHLYAATRETALVVALALVLSLVIKTWLLQAFFIPSGSMEDTLLEGDRVIVSKLVPDVVPVQRGDIVVFRDPDHWLPPTTAVDRGPLVNGLTDVLEYLGLLPSSAEDHLIKRVIGLPGDTVTCCDASGRLLVNGVAITEPYLKPGDVPSSMSFDITVPEGRVWVMGDHRSNSEDSRFHDPEGDGSQGSVPISDLTGRAVLRVWPLSRLGWLDRFADTFATVPNASAGSPRPVPTGQP